MPQSSSISSSGTGPPSMIGGSINPTMIMPSSIAATGFGKTHFARILYPLLEIFNFILPKQYSLIEKHMYIRTSQYYYN